MEIKFNENDGGRIDYFPSQKKKDVAGDCVIRSIAITTGLDYMEVWNKLFELGTEIGQLPNDQTTYTKFLNSMGIRKLPTLKDLNGKKYRLHSFPLTKGKYIIHTTNHLTTVVNGVVNDTWDCRNWCCNSYYKID
jgi:hypothetical protein